MNRTQHVNRTTQTIINRGEKRGESERTEKNLSSSSVMMMAITKSMAAISEAAAAAAVAASNIIFIMSITFTINTKNLTQYIRIIPSRNMNERVKSARVIKNKRENRMRARESAREMESEQNDGYKLQ